jgi:hypothetical protein
MTAARPGDPRTEVTATYGDLAPLEVLGGVTWGQGPRHPRGLGVEARPTSRWPAVRRVAHARGARTFLLGAPDLLPGRATTTWTWGHRLAGDLRRFEGPYRSRTTATSWWMVRRGESAQGLTVWRDLRGLSGAKEAAMPRARRQAQARRSRVSASSSATRPARPSRSSAVKALDKVERIERAPARPSSLSAGAALGRHRGEGRARARPSGPASSMTTPTDLRGDRITAGPNGAGKTTLLNLLDGRLPPTTATSRSGTT